MPILKPRQQLLGVASVTLLADNLSNVRRFVLVDPQQRRGCRVADRRRAGALSQLRRLTVLGPRSCRHIAAL